MEDGKPSIVREFRDNWGWISGVAVTLISIGVFWAQLDAMKVNVARIEKEGSTVARETAIRVDSHSKVIEALEAQLRELTIEVKSIGKDAAVTRAILEERKNP